MAADDRSKREILAESPLFANVLPVELTMLAELVTDHRYGAGEFVFQEGDIGDALYVIVEGSVEVLSKNTHGQALAITVLHAPEFFGEMSLIDKEYRSATIRAATEARLLRLANDNLHVFAKNYRNGFTWIMVNIARVLSARLRQANRRLAELL